MKQKTLNTISTISGGAIALTTYMLLRQWNSGDELNPIWASGIGSIAIIAVHDELKKFLR